MRLDKAKIVEVALDLLEDHAFDALSLRKIADACGVQTPALYWHIEDRAELYGLMAEAMLRESLESIDPDLQGSAFLIAFGHALHDTHMRRRDAAKLLALAPPSAVTQGQLLPIVIDRLVAGGFERSRAAQAQSAVQSFTLGWSLFKENERVDAVMAKMMDVDAAFQRGLEALAMGFAE